MKKTLLFLLCCTSFVFTSCNDDDNDGGGSGSGTITEQGCYVVNTGNWGGNDATIQYYDLLTGVATSPGAGNDMFTVSNDSLLGDLAQDLLWLNDTLYVTVSGSQKLEILDINGSRIKDPVKYSGTKASPRCITTDGKNVYVTNYDGHVYVYDAATATQVQKFYSGSYPEGISYINGYLVVNNSNYGGGGAGVPSVSVINASTGEMVKNITENVYNPYVASVICNDEVYIIDSGNYFDIPSRICRVSIADGKLHSLNESAALLATYDGLLFFANSVYNDKTQTNDYSPLYSLNVATGEKKVILPALKMKDISSLNIDPKSGMIYLGYATNGVLGTMRCYNLQGVEKASFTIGYFTTGARFKY